MKLFRLLVCCFMVFASLLSCKDDVKETEENTVAETTESSEETKKTIDTETQLTMVNSVLGKLMATPETKTFTRYVVTVNLMDMLSKTSGPYTVIAPSNEAFEGLSEYTVDFLAHADNREALTTLMKNHMVEGNLSSAELLQLVKKNGAHTLHTMGGASLMVYLEGDDIMIKDAEGVAAKIGKSDFIAENGKVHLINAVLTAPK